MLKRILLLPLCGIITSAYALPLKPFQATYISSYDMGFTIDIEAQRTLKQKENGHWVLDFRASNWFARIQQTSTFELNSQQELQPLLYRRYQKIFGETKEQKVIFHWDKQQVTNDIDNRPWRMSIPKGTQDLMSYQLKLRYDVLQNPAQKEFHYQIADGGKIKEYIFRVAGEEVLKTPMGKLNAIRLESRRHSRKTVGHLIWLAKDWDNLVLRIDPVRRKDEEEPVILKKAILDGRHVQGF